MKPYDKQKKYKKKKIRTRARTKVRKRGRNLTLRKELIVKVSGQFHINAFIVFSQSFFSLHVCVCLMFYNLIYIYRYFF